MIRKASNTKKQWARIHIWKHYFVTSYFLLIILYSAFKANMHVGRLIMNFILRYSSLLGNIPTVKGQLV